MIAINLLPGAKRKRGGKGAGLQLPDFKALAASIKDPWLIACAASVVVLVAVIAVLWLPRRAQIAALGPQLETAKRQAAQMRVVLRQKAETEAKRDSLLAQMNVISAIDRERYIWPHILDAVTKALPQYTWLDAITPRVMEADSGDPGVGFELTGKSADIQAITRFVRNLEESAFLERATIVSTGAVTEQGREVYTFVFNAKFQRPDTTTLTMRPLASTLVQGYRSGSRPGTR